MRNRSEPHSRSFPIEKILFFVSIAFVLSCVIVAVKMDPDGEGDAFAGAREATEPTTGRGASPSTGADSPEDGEGEAEMSAARRSEWPQIDRVARLRFGVVQDVADAFELGKYSGLVSLATESEQRLFDSWCARAAAWSDPWNRDPVLYADGEGSGGARAYRVELHGEELGRIHLNRYANGWNIVAVERKLTKADLLAEERIIREAATRAGVAGIRADNRKSEASGTTNQEREQRDQ